MVVVVSYFEHFAVMFIVYCLLCLQCFDIVGWASERASGL